MTSILIRTAIIYILLAFTLRITGKRQLGELDVGDLITTLLISEIAAIPIDDPEIPLLNAILPILFLLSVEIIVSTLKNKSEKAKRLLDGDASYIIYKGRLLQNALKNNRISVNEMLASMRSQGIGGIEDVEYALLEQNGTLSFLRRGDGGISQALIIDGAVIEASLKRLGYDGKWLERSLDERGIRREDVFLMSIDDSGIINIIKKEDGGEAEG
ncbi:MAG: DUF421 domain-containing protein [Clostridia bacterium]|nr:DUF421 domain-containing protein [Clostridia bacterium]